MWQSSQSSSRPRKRYTAPRDQLSGNDSKRSISNPSDLPCYKPQMVSYIALFFRCGNLLRAVQGQERGTLLLETNFQVMIAKEAYGVYIRSPVTGVKLNPPLSLDLDPRDADGYIFWICQYWQLCWHHYGWNDWLNKSHPFYLKMETL